MTKQRKYRREDLRAIARYQKGIILCILVYLAAIVVGLMLPREMRFITGAIILVAAVLSSVFVFLLATVVYGQALGIVYGLITLIPCAGLIMLLIINSSATGLLKQHGISVGLLGAKSSDL